MEKSSFYTVCGHIVRLHVFDNGRRETIGLYTFENHLFVYKFRPILFSKEDIAESNRIVRKFKDSYRKYMKW